MEGGEGGSGGASLHELAGKMKRGPGHALHNLRNVILNTMIPLEKSFELSYLCFDYFERPFVTKKRDKIMAYAGPKLFSNLNCHILKKVVGIITPYTPLFLSQWEGR